MTTAPTSQTMNIQELCEKADPIEIQALAAVAQMLSIRNTHLESEHQKMLQEYHDFQEEARKRIYFLKQKIVKLDHEAAHNRKVAIQVADLTHFGAPRLSEMLNGTVTCADDFTSLPAGT